MIIKALDNVTSYQIEKSILNIENLTKIIITHKLNKDILVEYDMIIVVKDGKVVETGDFEELIKK